MRAKPRSGGAPEPELPALESGVRLLDAESDEELFLRALATAADVGDDFETLGYPMEDGTVQTTPSFWQRVLAARVSATASAETPTPAKEVTHGTN